MSMKYPIHEIHYHTNNHLECDADVAAESCNIAENLLRSKCWEDYCKLAPRVDEFSFKVKKIIPRVLVQM